MTASAGTGPRLLGAAGAALPSGLGVVAALGAVALVLRPDAWTTLAVPVGVGIAWLAWARPEAAVALLLAVAPICGNRPTTGPFLAFIGLTACAVPGWLARLVTRDRAEVLDLLGTPVGLALAGYCGASLLSLSSLPVYAPAEIVGAATIGEAWSALPGALAGADVVTLAYPLLTVVLTLHAAVAAVTVAVAVRRDGARHGPDRGVDAARLVAAGILVGLVASIAAGALDRLGLLDLRLLRATDPFTNASGAERLQSTFGHAGWFAQYLCFATPVILGLWLWPATGAAGTGAREPAGVRLARVAAAAVLLLATLAAIVLSNQRGGWITWAIVGTSVVATVVRLAADSRGAATVPPLRRLIAVAVGALLLALVAGPVVIRVAGGPGAMDRFAARARTLTQVSDRQAHVTAGLRLGAQRPILGGGSESFAWRYQQEYLRAGGAYYARGYSPVLDMYGSAHNVFAQTFAGKGAVGLVALLLLVIASAAAAIRTLRRPALPRRERILALIALGITGAFTIYGQVQEVFYIPVLQLTVFAGFALAAGARTADRIAGPLVSPARRRHAAADGRSGAPPGARLRRVRPAGRGVPRPGVLAGGRAAVLAGARRRRRVPAVDRPARRGDRPAPGDRAVVRHAAVLADGARGRGAVRRPRDRSRAPDGRRLAPRGLPLATDADAAATARDRRRVAAGRRGGQCWWWCGNGRRQRSRRGRAPHPLGPAVT